MQTCQQNRFEIIDSLVELLKIHGDGNEVGRQYIAGVSLVSNY